MNLNFRWVEKTGRFQSGESLQLNKLDLADYSYNSSYSRALPQAEKDKIRYIGSVVLPQAQSRVYGETPEIIKVKIERIVTGWFNEALK